MLPKNIYILHKNGAKSHYTALEHLLKSKEAVLKHREFSIFSKLFKSITHLDFKALKKQLINLGFIINLIITKNKIIVLGIAPFDSKLIWLLKVLKHHQVYYHTSWTYWDKSFHPKQKKNSAKVFETWRYFLEQKAKHIFAVTEHSKCQLISNYSIMNNNISVVYHSLDSAFLKPHNRHRKKNSFIYFGRIVPQKGIKELINVFSKKQNLSLTIIGNGKERYLVEGAVKKYNNIEYIPHVDDKNELINKLSKHEFLILNSIRNNKWEELFGLAIIESMAQGVLPIATNHSGPKEIITSDMGYLYKEKELENIIDKVIKKGFDKSMSDLAIEKAQDYTPEKIAKLWKPILNKLW